MMSKKKADAISNGVFLISLGILAFTDLWWPGILLVLWVTLGIRQFFSGRYYDFAMSTILLLGLFAISLLQFNWSVLAPVLLVLGGIHIIFREYSLAAGAEEDEEEYIEETEKEIEDESTIHTSKE